MNRLFRERAIHGVTVDPDSNRSKHDSVALRENYSPWRAGNRRRFITSRRLSDWLVSDWHHKRRHMGLPDLDFEPVRSGLSYSLRLGGTWVAADWWLQYFEVDQSVTPLRLEHLKSDLNTHLLPLLPSDTPLFESPPRDNSRPSATGSQRDAQLFDANDLARMASANPRWAAWEDQVYGEPGQT